MKLDAIKTMASVNIFKYNISSNKNRRGNLPRKAAPGHHWVIVSKFTSHFWKQPRHPSSRQFGRKSQLQRRACASRGERSAIDKSRCYTSCGAICCAKERYDIGPRQFACRRTALSTVSDLAGRFPLRISSSAQIRIRSRRRFGLIRPSMNVT